MALRTEFSQSSTKPGRVQSHFQFFQRFHLNTWYREMFHGNKRLDGRNIYFHNTTHLERDLETQ